MLNERFRLRGLFAVLLALMVQLGAGASVPAVNPLAGAAVLCHSDDAYTDDTYTGDTGRSPSHTPGHMPADCPMCPLCSAPHVSSATLIPVAPPLSPPARGIVAKVELPPSPTGPPASHWPPGQPRAPPIFS